VVCAPIQGGVVHQVLDLVRFDPSGPPEVVLPPWPGLDRVARRFVASGARVHRLAPAPRPDGAGAWLATRAVDLVHVHFASAHDATATAESALAAGIRVVSTDHACPGGDGQDAAWKARRAVAALQDALGADSAAVAEPLAARLGRPVRVLLHGIEPERFECLPSRDEARRSFGISAGRPVVGSVGALFSAKGMHRVLDAAARLPGTVVLLAGEGPERPRLEARARALGVELHLPGWLDDVRPALAAMDVFALSSDSEGLPTAVLQAMAAGVPVVAVDAGGVREALGGCGALVPAGDEQAFRDALAAALGGALVPRIGAARHRVRTRFDIRRLARDVAALHESALWGAARPR
jgi:glycosyltransferase involved in cell wall biosynthesis